MFDWWWSDERSWIGRRTYDNGLLGNQSVAVLFSIYNIICVTWSGEFTCNKTSWRTQWVQQLKLVLLLLELWELLLACVCCMSHVLSVCVICCVRARVACVMLSEVEVSADKARSYSQAHLLRASFGHVPSKCLYLTQFTHDPPRHDLFSINTLYADLLANWVRSRRILFFFTHILGKLPIHTRSHETWLHNTYMRNVDTICS